MNPTAASNSSATKLPDAQSRKRIVNDLDTSLFVEAGAGSGKTKALVDRVLELVDSGVDITRLAAITFTERAAGELRDRIRRALRDSIDEAPDDEIRELRIRAVEDVDDAAIGTLHAFARRLLAEHPVEAGLPLTFTVRDALSSEIAGRGAWAERTDALFEREDLAQDIALARAGGVTFDHLRQMAEALDSCWDEIDAGRFAEPERVDLEGLRTKYIRGLMELRAYADDCLVDEDKLRSGLLGLEDDAAEVRDASATELLSIWASGTPTFKFGGGGQKQNWPGGMKQEILDAGAEMIELRSAAHQEIVENAVRRIVPTLAHQVVATAEHRRITGSLSFDDLLVLARRLLIDNPNDVRRRLHARYTHILLDEFQDTDPLQVDIAMRLTADPDDDSATDQLAPVDGHLFTVGDPKQSIYMFRGADLALYLRTRRRLTEGENPVGRAESLTTNFRSVGPIIDWVNHTFERIITETEDSQPAYEALDSFRGDDGLAGPAVVQLGVEAHEAGVNIEDVRRAEACDLAETIIECVGQGDGPHWQVAGEEHSAGEEAQTRPAKLEDIAILIPTRTGLAIITDELDRAGIPYRTESSGLVYASPEVRALITTLRAIDDPDDEFSLVSALRSVLFGCGDDDLLRFRMQHPSRWSINADLETVDTDNPVVESIAFLRELARTADWASPAAVLDELVRGRRLLELGRTDTRPRDLWRRVRYVIDQAHAWAASGGGSLGDYIEWAESQIRDAKNVNEAILPETDDDAVRLLTIHASKGLEFPIVFCVGLGNYGTREKADTKIVLTERSWEYYIKKGITSARWDANAATPTERKRDERSRQLYVACARARDHLVVSTHRAVKKSGAPVDDEATTMADACAEAGAVAMGFGSGGERSLSGVAEPDGGELAAHDQWRDRLDEALAGAQIAETIKATALAKETSVDDVKLGVEPEVEGASVESGEEPAQHADDTTATTPTRRSRDGAAFGSAVHAVLAEVDPNHPDQVEALARIYARQEGVEDEWEAVARLAHKALATPIVAESFNARRWTEVYVCGELDGQLVEGVIDLMYEADEGLVIVDYKTDAVGSEEFARIAVAYQRQVEGYVKLVGETIGQTVLRGVLLHLTESGAIEHES